MSKLIIDGEEVCSGGVEVIPVTQAEYNALSETARKNGTYLITDADGLTATDVAYDDSETGLGVDNVQDAIVEQSKNLGNLDNKVGNKIGFIDTSRVINTLTTGQHTATEDCWCIGSFTANYGEWAFITLDGVYVASVMGTHEAKKQEPTCCFPVQRGQVVSVRDGSSYSYNLKFYPMINA